MRRTVAVIGLIVALSAGSAAAAGEGAAVSVTGASRATTCQEEDNVYVTLSAPAIRHLRIEVVPPPYLDRISADRTAPDFTGCDMRDDPRFFFAPKTLTLFEDAEIALVGHTFASFWRPDAVPVRVGATVTPSLHLLQLFLKIDGRAEEFLVLYPADGYWRAKPLPPAHLGGNAYGSSFLVGPVEEHGRPLVALAAVTFAPATRAFGLDFADGSAGRLAVAEISAQRVVLAVELTEPVAAARPFAALRSMFVRPDAADAAVVGWQAAPGGSWQSLPIMDLTRVEATTVRFGRDAVSLHNTSAPDLIFGDFQRARAAP